MKSIRQEVDTARSIDDIVTPRTQAVIGRLCTIGIFAVAVLFALHEASSIVAPMAAAIIVGMVLSRMGDRAQALGIPPFVSATLFMVATAVGIVLAGAALTARLSSIMERAPELAARFSTLTAPLLRPLQMLKTQIFGGGEHQAAAPAFDMGAVTGVLGGLTPALGGVLIFLATLFFFVAGKNDLRRKIVLAWPARENRLVALRILNGVEEALAHYFGSASLIYLALAIATAALAWATGLGAPFLWAVFVFVACFIPFVGVLLVTAALLVAGFTVHDGFIAGAAPAVIYFLIHLVLENAALPAIVGRRFEVNPFLVFVSIVFWTWVWGAIGAVIASPMLLMLKIVIDELRETDAPALPE